MSEDPENFQEKKCRTYSPEIKIKIINDKLNGLLDTGSMVSAINQEYLKTLRENLPPQFITTIPVQNLQIKTAVNKKSKKITEQVIIPVWFNNEVESNLYLLVIPELKHKIIIGSNLMEELKNKFDIRNKFWEIIHEENIYKIPFVNMVKISG